jgi:RNA recognition motif-containing protein
LKIEAVDDDVAKMNIFHSTITIVQLLNMLRPTSENIGNPCAVYAGNLSWSTTEEQLLSFAGADRGAISAEIKRHKDTKRSKGWGYGSN